MRQTADLTSTVRRGALLVASAAGLAALLAGCGAGQISQTAMKGPSVPGVHAEAGDVSLRNLQVVYGGRAHRSYQKGSDAPLEVRMFNTGSEHDVLTGVSSPAADRVVLVTGEKAEGDGVCPAAKVDAIPDQQPGADDGESGSEEAASGEVAPAGAAASEFTIALRPGSCALLVPGQEHHLRLSGLTEELAPGDLVEVTFTFGQAGETTVEVPFGMPTEGADHSPVNMHPEEPEIVGGHKGEGGEGEGGH